MRLLLVLLLPACFSPGDAAFASCDVDDDCGLGRVCAPRQARCVAQDDVPPAAPGDVRVDDVRNESALLSFIAPGDDGSAAGTAVDQITVRFLDEEGEVADERVLSDQPALAGAVQRTLLDRLDAATVYTVVVRVLDDVDNAAESDPISFVTAGALACAADGDCSLRPGSHCGGGFCTDDVTAPAPPDEVAVIDAATTTTSLTLSLRASGDDAFSGSASSFSITATPLQPGEAAVVVDAPVTVPGGSLTRVAVTGLARGTAYELVVSAVDEAGNVGGDSQPVIGETGGALCDEEGVAVVGTYQAETAADLLALQGCTRVDGTVTIDDTDCELTSLDALAALEEITNLTYNGGGLNCRTGVTSLGGLRALRSGFVVVANVAFDLELRALQTGGFFVRDAAPGLRVTLPAFGAGTVGSNNVVLDTIDVPVMLTGSLDGTVTTLLAPRLEDASIRIQSVDDVVLPALVHGDGDIRAPRIEVPLLEDEVGLNSGFRLSGRIFGARLALFFDQPFAIHDVDPASTVVRLRFDMNGDARPALAAFPDVDDVIIDAGGSDPLDVTGHDRTFTVLRGALVTSARLSHVRIGAAPKGPFPLLLLRGARVIDELELLDPSRRLVQQQLPTESALPDLEQVKNAGFDAAYFAATNDAIAFRFVSGAVSFVNAPVLESYDGELDALDVVAARERRDRQPFIGTRSAVGDIVRIRGSGAFTVGPTGTTCLGATVAGYINTEGNRCVTAGGPAQNIDVVFENPGGNLNPLPGVTLAGARL